MMVSEGTRLFAFPYSGYWMDVGTIPSYWQAHMDLLGENPSLRLNDRSWIIHTRTEERPPARLSRGVQIADSMISEGCIIESGANVEQSVLSPGVTVMNGAVVRQSVLLTDCVIESGAVIERAILDKRVRVGEKARIGGVTSSAEPIITLIGKNSQLPAEIIVEPGAVVGTDIIPSDLEKNTVKASDFIHSKRQPYEI